MAGIAEQLHAAIDAKLAEIVTNVSPAPAWYGRWKTLRPNSTDEERLAVCQAIRDSGVLPADAGFFLVSWQVDFLTDKAADVALRDQEERLDAIKAAHGLDAADFWVPGEGPPEYTELLAHYHDAWDALFADQLEKYGEAQMARLMREDREEYDRRDEAGRHFFHGPRHSEEEVWLDLLLEAVGDAVELESPMGPLVLRYDDDDGFWDVDVYPTPVELVGGANDGAIVTANFSLDLERLRAAFERIDDSGWNALGWCDGDGPFVWIEGSFAGREVWLRVLSQAPDGEEPGVKLRLTPRGEK